MLTSSAAVTDFSEVQELRSSGVEEFRQYSG
jgi:hypothetical protein